MSVRARLLDHVRSDVTLLMHEIAGGIILEGEAANLASDMTQSPSARIHIVTPWLAMRLREIGETVHEVCGLQLWLRHEREILHYSDALRRAFQIGE